MKRNKRSDYLPRYSRELIQAVVARNAGAAADAVEKIALQYGGPGILTACRTAAEMARRTAYPTMRRGDGTLNGSFMYVEQRPGGRTTPEMLWAAQFFAAHVNGDDPTLAALFLADFDTDPTAHSRRVVTLLTMCAHILRGDM